MAFLSGFHVGDHVIVEAKDDFYAYIDGWRGRVTGHEAGCVRIEVSDEGLQKVFLVPADELRLTVSASR
jgi:ribosomal protein L21E